MSFVFPPGDIPRVAIHGSGQWFPVHRIYCVGQNYADHAREMGDDPDREPPFFFSKPADAVVLLLPAPHLPGPTLRTAISTMKSNWWWPRPGGRTSGGGGGRTCSAWPRSD
jgi:hypothetical protein